MFVWAILSPLHFVNIWFIIVLSGSCFISFVLFSEAILDAVPWPLENVSAASFAEGAES